MTKKANLSHVAFFILWKLTKNDISHASRFLFLLTVRVNSGHSLLYSSSISLRQPPLHHTLGNLTLSGYQNSTQILPNMEVLPDLDAEAEQQVGYLIIKSDFFLFWPVRCPPMLIL